MTLTTLCIDCGARMDVEGLDQSSYCDYCEPDDPREDEWADIAIEREKEERHAADENARDAASLTPQRGPVEGSA